MVADLAAAGADVVAAILTSDNAERDRALWRSTLDVLRVLDEHYTQPRNLPTVPTLLRGATRESIQQRRDDPGFALAFGQFRFSVMAYEEQSARRLEVLRGTARTLLRLRDHAPERVDEMLQHLADFVAREWRLDLGLDAGREWALRVTMRFDLLPPSWRDV